MSCQIKHLDKLLGAEIVSSTTTKLTEVGDNYGSSIIGVDIKIKDGDTEKQIHAVAKMIPNNPFIQELFNSQKTFSNEVGFYETVAPVLKEFQKKQGLTTLIDSTPELIAARISLDSNTTVVDDDAVLLIKNLKYDGFGTINRISGFDLEQAKIILEKIAELHATTMALKNLKPDLFDKKLKPFFEKYKVFAVDRASRLQMYQAVFESIKEDDVYAQMFDKLEELFEEHIESAQVRNTEFMHHGPFLGLTHSDLWANNILLKIENGKTVDVKFVDFQIYEYTSISRDVVFFIFSSVQMPILRQHCDDLILHYYKSLIKMLDRLNYDTSILKYDDFVEDIGLVVKKNELFHFLIMLAPIYAQKDNTFEVDSINKDEIIGQRNKLSQDGKERASFAIREFIRRKWI